MNEIEKVRRDQQLEKAITKLRKCYKKIEEEKYKNSIIVIIDEPHLKKYKYKTGNKK